MLLLVGLLQIPHASSAQAAPTGSRTVDVTIDSMSPSAPSKSDTVTVSGTLTNDGRSTITDAHVGMHRGSALGGRSSIESASRRTGYLPGTDGEEIKGHTEKIGKLEPGASRSFSLSVPAKDLNLGDNGVYQLGISLSGRSPSAPSGQVLGFDRTFLPWQTGGIGKKTQLTYMWPLISRTHLTAETDADAQQTPVFRNDDLAAELAPGGRLQQMVALGKNLPVTFVIDPDLLATVDAMTKSYRVNGPDGPMGKNQAVAKQWLHDLEEAVKSHQVVALPFADPDLASLAHHGKSVPSALSHLGPATDLADKTVDTILGVKPRTDFAWPVDGAIDSSIVDVATSAGAHNVITRSDSLRDADRLSYTPTAARPIGGGNTAVVADAQLSRAFEGDMSKAGNSAHAVQDFLAQTQMISLEDPGRQRSIVVAPQRMPSVSQAHAMAGALRSLDESGSWTQSLNLGGAAKAKPDRAATRHVPSGAAYPSSLRRQELPVNAFRQVQGTQSALDEFQVILAQPERVVTPFGNAMMREMSTEWRGDATGATTYRHSVRSYLDGLTKKVHLIQKSGATLSGRSATIPVTVQNNLVQGVKDMTLKLSSSQPNRLDAGKSQQITVDGGHSQSFKFDTTANANGRAWVTAQLYTADGKPYGEPMMFQVNVTEITATVMLVIAGGVLLLVLAGVRIYLQRKRAAARRTEDGSDGDEPDDGAGTDDDNGGTDGDEPEQPSDPTPDTGSESSDPSGSGEKVDR
ncbi:MULTISPECIES: DUF6049 family protein [unclassified Streptomyces]|uniref:DUF6049 family protein n=1 Tax=unclassified Streptomyces TaxID=2593676 RepID=UPI00088A87D2|nr:MULTISPECIES: DUF6049 family protein [unclassified Streptomyces]PBC83699.1 hypothetical protein BX261_3652 [Streptomyces sp. 2321.6]SDR39777.1 hypothetical protein SAMN05216511_3549 [Streptomyces sp. KS_16]SED05022.1 hypothetical protein SAMN05428940_3654 [Streptomyces sp. 2133.1]SNC69777.1 hypothetical protein SAMN06272741_3646 [Streptomyces sp. 2114.4]